MARTSLTVGTVVRLTEKVVVQGAQGHSTEYEAGLHGEIVNIEQVGSRTAFKIHFEGGNAIDVWEHQVSRVRTQVDVLEDILVALQEIAQAHKPVEISEVKMEVHPVELTNEAIARGVKAASYAVWGEDAPKLEKTRTKLAKDLKTGEIVRLNEKWELVSKVLPLAHGDVWVYNVEGAIIARVKGDREVKVKVVP